LHSEHQQSIVALYELFPTLPSCGRWCTVRGMARFQLLSGGDSDEKWNSRHCQPLLQPALCGKNASSGGEGCIKPRDAEHRGTI